MTSVSMTVVIFALICFFVDAATAYLFDAICTQWLLALYLCVLAYLPSIVMLTIISSLIALQDLLFFGQAGIQLIYLIPLTIATHGLARIMYPNSAQLLVAGILAGIAQTYGIRALVLHQHVVTCYTVQTIYGIMMGIIMISLIYWLRGKLGNRMRTP